MEIRSVALKNRPEGIPKSEDFQVITEKLEPPKENEIQVRNVCIVFNRVFEFLNLYFGNQIWKFM